MSGGTIVPATTVVREEQVQRYTFIERAYHWINSFAYTYLMLTGLALFTPLAYWLGYVFGGPATMRFWHPWVGLVYFFTIIWMHGKWKRDMRKIPQDDQWTKNIRAYVENQDEKMPPAGALQRRTKAVLVGNVLLHVYSPDHGNCHVVPGEDPAHPALDRPGSDLHPLSHGAGHDCGLHHPRLYRASG